MPKIIATKNDWIKLGFKLFSEFGELGLNVDKMARILKCNKSSFYWHFKTKKDFIDCLVNYWIDIDTSKIIAEVNHHEKPFNRLLKLVEIVFKQDPDIDFIFYLKKYSRSNESIAKIVYDIDKQRIKFVSNLLKDLGCSSNDAKLKAGLFYKYLIGYHEMIKYRKQKRKYVNDVLNELRLFMEVEIPIPYQK